MLPIHILMRDLSHEVDCGRITQIDAALKISAYIQKALNCATVSFWTVTGDPGTRVMRRVAGYDGVNDVYVTHAVEAGETNGGYFNALVRAGCYVCSDTFADPSLADVADTLLVRYRIHALLSASWGANGAVHGIISCTDSVVRKWHAVEITAVRRCASEVSMRQARRRTLASG
jgi:hypothetical protein